MDGYQSVVDYWTYWGVNSTQQPTITIVTLDSFRYRNFLMGFNQIYLNLPDSPSDFMIQLHFPPPQTIYLC